MAFLLGSFTDGLFGGAKDVMSIANEWEGLKQKRMVTQAAEDAKKATADQRALDAGASKASPASAKPSTAAPTKYTEPDFSSLPAPKWMSDKVTKEALPLLPKASPDNPSEGKARLRSTKSAAATPDVAERDSFARPEGLIKQGIGVASRAGAAIGQALVGGGAKAAPAAEAPIPAAPSYLPPGALGEPGSTWALPPAPQQPARPQAAIGNPMPNLASNQTGLGPRILAALNPAAGSTS